MPLRISNISISFLAILTSSLISSLLPLPAFCQRDYDPNLGHFYMGRQQWTVEDNSPVIIDKTGTASGAMNGALQNRPVPLPKAGWQGYAPIDTPATNTGASKNFGHSQTSKPRHSQAGNKGKAGNLTGNSPSGIQSYKPYATYQNPVANPNAGNSQQTSQHVKGSLLHWTRRTPKQE